MYPARQGITTGAALRQAQQNHLNRNDWLRQDLELASRRLNHATVDT